MTLANNLLAVTCEAMVMGIAAGIDPSVSIDVIDAGSGRNSASQDKSPCAIPPGTFDVGFDSGLSYTDVRLCIDDAETIGAPLVVGAAGRELLAVTNAMYGAEPDFMSICRMLESWGASKSAAEQPRERSPAWRRFLVRASCAAGRRDHARRRSCVDDCLSGAAGWRSRRHARRRHPPCRAPRRRRARERS